MPNIPIIHHSYWSVLQRWRHLRTRDQLLRPAFYVGVVVERDGVAFTPCVEGDETDIRQRELIADQIVFAGQGVVESAQVLIHAHLGFLRVTFFLQVAPSRVNSCVKEIHPNSHLGAVELIARHERHVGKFLVEIFVNHRRLVDDPVAIYQHRHFAVGILLNQIFRLVLEIDFDLFVRDVFFGQDNPCPVGVGSSLAGVEFHERCPPCSEFNYHRRLS